MLSLLGAGSDCWPLLGYSDSAALSPVHCRGFAEGVKRVAKQVQGALPLVGLLSRLASPSGGIGRDELVSCRLSYCYREDLDSQEYASICTMSEMLLLCLLQKRLPCMLPGAGQCPPHMLLAPAGTINADSAAAWELLKYSCSKNCTGPG